MGNTAGVVRSARGVRRLAAAVAVLAVVVSGCSGGTKTPEAGTGTTAPAQSAGSVAPAQRPTGGKATIALPPGQQPNYIFPFLDWSHQSVTNVAQFQKLMFRPLYWGSSGDQPVINRDLSLAEPLQWNTAHTEATMKLKDYSWSDGSKLTVDNVAFWMGLVQYAGKGWVGNSAGYYPGNLSKVAYDKAAGTVTFTLKTAVAPEWFESNVLGNTTPLPAAWDLEGDGKQGSCSSTDPAKQQASCPKVREYLEKQAADLSSYATNPLWQVVNGPWKLSKFNADGNVTMVPNDKYSGPVKPALAELQFLPFTSESAEFNALKAGSTISVGYVPTAYAPAAGDGFRPSRSPLGPDYDIVPRYTWGFDYLVLNQQNPQVGALFRQLYFRQALQHSVDQDTQIKVALKGYGVPTYGPIPTKPENPYLGPAGTKNLYPFSEADAHKLLVDNGWQVDGDGPAVCVKPGAGAGNCGEGVAAGAKAEFKLEFISGSPSVSAMIQQLQSSAGKAGIKIELSEAPYNTVIADAATCTAADAACSWQAASWGAGWTFLTSFYPTGEKLFATGAGSNFSNYADPKMDELVAATVNAPGGTDALHAYEQYAAEQLPVLYLPTTVSLIAVDKKLGGVSPVSPLQVLTPENWYLNK